MKAHANLYKRGAAAWPGGGDGGGDAGVVLGTNERDFSRRRVATSGRKCILGPVEVGFAAKKNKDIRMTQGASDIPLFKQRPLLQWH